MVLHSALQNAVILNPQVGGEPGESARFRVFLHRSLQ
jgi:hypothetical protein